MRVATYTRKSVYSDRSDSVSNQERMCRDYVKMKFGDGVETFTVYQDEGFTGANTDRPGLKRLLADIDVGKIDVLVVYQLDRISRSVKDFSEIWDRLERNRVAFMSLKENMDTDTPLGRAMIYISMVFAQMERETIAERVADNARGLAMKGLWTCGAPPTGYKVEPVVVDGKKHFKLAIDEDSAEYVREIYRDFLATGKATAAISEAKPTKTTTLDSRFSAGTKAEASRSVRYRLRPSTSAPAVTTPYRAEKRRERRSASHAR